MSAKRLPKKVAADLGEDAQRWASERVGDSAETTATLQTLVGGTSMKLTGKLEVEPGPREPERGEVG